MQNWPAAVPLIAIDCGLSAALSATVSVALLVAGDVEHKGENVT
jgi:hypothetical protein